MRWFVHVQRRNSGYISRRMLRMKLPDWRQRGGPKMEFIDMLREDMKVVVVIKQDAADMERGSAPLNTSKIVQK